MREMRSLGFTDREVITAVIDLMRKQREPIPNGQIQGILMSKDPVAAEITVIADDGTRSVLHCSAAELAAALVNYCIERRIKLPSTGRKFVELIAGSLNLIIYMEDSAATRAKRNFSKPPPITRNQRD